MCCKNQCQNRHQALKKQCVWKIFLHREHPNNPLPIKTKNSNYGRLYKISWCKNNVKILFSHCKNAFRNCSCVRPHLAPGKNEIIIKDLCINMTWRKNPCQNMKQSSKEYVYGHPNNPLRMKVLNNQTSTFAKNNMVKNNVKIFFNHFKNAFTNCFCVRPPLSPGKNENLFTDFCINMTWCKNSWQNMKQSSK